MSFVQTVRSRKSGPGTFIAVAAYQDLAAPFVASLFSSALEIQYRLDFEVFAGNCHHDDARNRLVRDFLESDCEQLVFLDADVFWQAKDLEKLIEYDRDIVAGVYPRRADDQPFPVKELPGERWADELGLVEVEGVPTGFLKIKRKVLETLDRSIFCAHHRSKEDASGRRPIPIIFERSLDGHSRVGGDIEFCRKARQAGFKVYVDPMMELGHQGDKLFYGCLGSYWRRHVAIPEGVRAIREGKDKPETYRDMFMAWDNPYALTPEATFTFVQLARQANGPILECGAGWSTLCAGAATDKPVVSLESMPMWATRVAKQAKAAGLDNVAVCLAEPKQYDGGQWYAEFPQIEFSVVLSDGIEDRHMLFELMKRQISKATILVDDIERPNRREQAEDYCAKEGRRLEVFDTYRNQFGLIL